MSRRTPRRPEAQAAAAPPRVADLHLNVYGFRIEVHGPKVASWFRTEHGRFEAEGPAAPDLLIRPDPRREPKPIRPKGSTLGLRIDRFGKRTEIVYDAGLHPTHVLPWAESLLRWPSKVLAHAAGVARNGRASVFFAGPNTGKTTAVVGLVRNGYGFLADDWIVLGEGQAFPFPKTIHLYDYNLAQDAELCRQILPRGFPWRTVMRGRVVFKNRVVPYLPGRGLRFVADTALSRMIRNPDATQICPGAQVAGPSKLADAVWLTRYPGTEFRTSPLKPDALAERIVNAYLNERFPHLGRFALEAALDGTKFPFEERIRHKREILERTLAPARCSLLEIPRSAGPRQLLSALQSTLSG